MTVALEAVSIHDAGVLTNLMELYLHDLSEAIPMISLGPDGLFGYPELPLYWSEPDRRFPFFIKSDDAIVGFVLAARDDQNDYDVAEFFVLRSYRRSGLARRAAALLWNSFPGRWSVRVAESNPGAVQFWTKVIADYTSGTAIESRRPGPPIDWRVFSLASGGSVRAC